jgi:hypothetical protein
MLSSLLDSLFLFTSTSPRLGGILCGPVAVDLNVDVRTSPNDMRLEEHTRLEMKTPINKQRTRKTMTRTTMTPGSRWAQLSRLASWARAYSLRAMRDMSRAAIVNVWISTATSVRQVQHEKYCSDASLIQASWEDETSANRPSIVPGWEGVRGQGIHTTLKVAQQQQRLRLVPSTPGKEVLSIPLS